MADGWIKLHRKALDTPELQTFVRRGVWDYLLLKAARKTTGVVFRGKPVRIERGQLAVSINSLAQQQGIGRKQLRNILDSFSAAGMIKMDKAQGQAFTLLTIRNFAAFQETEHGEGPSARTSEGQVGAKSGPREQEGGEKGEGGEVVSLVASATPEPNIPNQMLEVWNSMLGDVLAKPRKLDKPRRAALESRFREDFGQDMEQWRAFCCRVRASPHLTGENDRGWKADLDFCLKPQKLNRILEGFYDARPNGRAETRQSRGDSDFDDQMRGVVERLERKRQWFGAG